MSKIPVEGTIDLDAIRPPKPVGLERQSEKKAIFSMLFATLAVALVLLPFVTTFNEFLTRIVETTGFWKFIQNYVVPVETRMIAVILRPFNIDIAATRVGLLVNGASVRLSWNCLGWQSLILMAISFLTGLQGSYTLISKIECVLIGLLGTFFVNLFRLSGIVVLAAYVSRVAAVMFHDYGSTLMLIFWLFAFWWYSHKFVLERRRVG